MNIQFGDVTIAGGAESDTPVRDAIVGLMTEARSYCLPVVEVRLRQREYDLLTQDCDGQEVKAIDGVRVVNLG